MLNSRYVLGTSTSANEFTLIKEIITHGEPMLGDLFCLYAYSC